MKRGLEFAVAAMALVLCALGPLGAQVFLTPLAALYVFSAGALLGLVAVVLGVVQAANAQETEPYRVRRALACAGLGLIPLILMTRGIWHSRGFSGLDDATTDSSRPVSFHHAPELAENAGRDFHYDAERGREISRRHPEIRPLLLPTPPNAAFADALIVAKSFPTWHVTWISQEQRTFEATSTTRAFRFTDDVVVEVSQEGSGASRVDVRSKSREPRGDFGGNARRIVTFLSRLQRLHGPT